MHDESHFPDPASFKPERWLDESGNLKDSAESPINPWAAVFGYGRRICPGRAFSRSSLWMYMATILSTCDIRMKVDLETLEPLVPAVVFKGDNVARYAGPRAQVDSATEHRYNLLNTCSMPEPFQCDIRPRYAS